MDIYFDEKILYNIFSNEALSDELCACISAVIDAELEKSSGEIDFDFIDECSNMLLEIQSSEVDYDKIIPVLNSDKFIQSTKRLAKGGVIKFAKIGLAAAIVFTSVLTANAAVGSITGKTIVEHIIESNNAPIVQETQSNPTTQYDKNNHIESSSAVSEVEEPTEASSVVYEPKTEKASVIYEEITAEPATVKHENANFNERKDDETTTQAPIVSGLDAVIIHSVFKTEYLIGEEFSANGLYLVANYSDASKKTIDISSCAVSGFDSSAPGLCRVNISYEGRAVIIEITVKEQETTTQAEDDNEENL